MTRRSSVVAALVAGIPILALAVISLAHLDRREGRAGPAAPQAAGERIGGGPRADPRAAAGAPAPLADIPLRGRYRSRTFLPGLPAIGAFDPASSLADTDETQLVQLVYDSYSRRSEGPDGERARFTLDGFRTVYRPQLDSIAFYPDLVTLGTDWELATVVRLAGGPGGERAGGRRAAGQKLVWLDPQWRRVENRAEEGAGAALLGRSALEVLALGAEHFPSRRRVVALTSYRVRAAFDGRAVRYRAAARWLLDEEGGVAFSIADNVVPEVGMAAGDSGEPDSFLAQPIAGLAAEPPQSAERAAGTCVQALSPPMSDRRSPSPDSGGFATPPLAEPAFVWRFRCSCDADCTSRCEAAIEPEACRFDSVPGDGGVEQRAVATAETLGAASPAGDREAARCSVGLRCTLVDCPDGTCGDVITRVDAGPRSLHLATTAAVAGDAMAGWTYGCGRCEPAVVTADQGDSAGQ